MCLSAAFIRQKSNLDQVHVSQTSLCEHRTKLSVRRLRGQGPWRLRSGGELWNGRREVPESGRGTQSDSKLMTRVFCVVQGACGLCKQAITEMTLF